MSDMKKLKNDENLIIQLDVVVPLERFVLVWFSILYSDSKLS